MASPSSTALTTLETFKTRTSASSSPIFHKKYARHILKTLPWEEGKWHTVKVVRDAKAGTITIWFDGKQAFSAEDKTFGKGKIGLGSFDVLGSFRMVEITAKRLP
jgi:hypothetical protein